MTEQQNLPLEEARCEEISPGKFRLSWAWRTGVAGYEVRWKRASATGNFAWQYQEAFTNGIDLALGQGLHCVEVYPIGNWGEKGKRPWRTKCNA